MFEPTVGRWLTEDPIGFVAGDENLYRFEMNGPIDHLDAKGLDATSDMLERYLMNASGAAGQDFANALSKIDPPYSRDVLTLLESISNGYGKDAVIAAQYKIATAAVNAAFEKLTHSFRDFWAFWGISPQSPGSWGKLKCQDCAASNALAASLIPQLGSQNFNQREMATDELNRVLSRAIQTRDFNAFYCLAEDIINSIKTNSSLEARGRLLSLLRGTLRSQLIKGYLGLFNAPDTQ